MEGTLPIFQYKQRIIDAIQKGRALVISGRTGCGKSTQVPQFILSTNPESNIAVCEPRRLAAVALAQRVSEERKSLPVGNQVGYQIGMDSKISHGTKIRFMTYGILIQELLYNKQISYSHIILDEVHERSMQMDFTFIALRKILDQTAMKHIKLIIMSATINSQQFCQYFSVSNHQSREFVRPKINYTTKNAEYNGRRQRNGRNKSNRKELTVQIIKNYENGSKSQGIQLPDKNQFKIKEYYLEDINERCNPKKQSESYQFPNYTMDQDVRIRESAYMTAVDIIRFFLRSLGQKKEGDILIFVPGMQQIKFLKNLIEKQLRVDPSSIIEVHSAYSEDLFYQLFQKKVSNKIIIATNIGQSSITLPSCKIVIDFCLNKKNITSKTKGITSYQTRIASKANLLQRAGRVGRTSNGEVYRLISRGQYDTLSDFEVPEIKCVTLQMVILRAKQIDKTCKSTLFEDPYDVFLNAIQPPKVSEIHDAVKYLLEEEALINEGPIQQNGKYAGQHLKLTRIGEFMVSMPCSIRVSKMIILSVQFGIVHTVLGIASILMSQKKFFQPEEKMDNIEEFMHSIIGYDQGEYNDFVLRQRIFSHWKSQFYGYTRKKKFKSKNKYENENDNENENLEQQLVENFCSKRVSREQKQWCNLRGISPYVMRDVLKIFEDLMERLIKMNIEVKEKHTIENQLVLLCLSIAFQDTTCQIQWKDRIKLKKKQKKQNVISLIKSKQTSQKSLNEYICPLQCPQYEYFDGGFIRIKGSCGVMSKFLLPIYYTKASLQKSSYLFEYLTTTPPKVSYTYQPALITQRVKQIYILNSSINKVCIRPNHNEEYMLIAQSIFSSKGRYYVGECALIEKKTLILIKMMTVKKVYLQLHSSGEFYDIVKINEDQLQLPFLLTNQDIDTIIDIRKFALWEKNRRIIEENTTEGATKSNVLTLLRSIKPKPMTETWHHIFNQLISQKQFTRFEPEPINQCSPLQCSKVAYFEEYNKWKLKQFRDMYYNFKIMTIRKSSIICSSCWPNQVTIIDDLSMYDSQKRVLPLNQYRGSFKIQKNKIYCIKNHFLGHIINKDQGQLENQKVMMYGPFERSQKFLGQQESISTFIKKEAEGLHRLEKRQKQIQSYECNICANYNEHQCIITKFSEYKINNDAKENKQFWRKIEKHMYSLKHSENAEKFLASC